MTFHCVSPCTRNINKGLVSNGIVVLNQLGSQTRKFGVKHVDKGALYVSEQYVNGILWLTVQHGLERQL